MEKKTEKKVTKTTKKVAAKKPVANKEIIKEEVKLIDYTNVLTKIFYCLIAIVVILVLNLITLLVIANNGTISTNNTATEESLEYDVSAFDTLTTTETVERIGKKGLEVVYIGRATCGYCAQFLPVLKEAQEEFEYKTIYIDLEQMTSDDHASLLALDNDEKYIEENFGYTPMVLIFKDGKLLDGWVGYAEYDTFAAFLEDSGL